LKKDSIFRPLQVPDRFESLLDKDRTAWGSFIMPVEESLSILQRLFQNTEISSRGQLFIVESRPGVGKTTFLNTAGIFMPDLDIKTIPSGQAIDLVLGPSEQRSVGKKRLYILEGRESIDHVTDVELGQLLHQLNQRLRAAEFGDVVVAWPCNSSKLADRIVRQASTIGGLALLDDEIGRHHFKGPDKKEFRRIASNTLTFLNDGADLTDLGIDEFTFTELINKSISIGDLFTKIVSEVGKRRAAMLKLQNLERHRVWVVVASGSQPEKEISGLTRGSYGACDIQRLCNSTQANIVRDVKEYPEKLGLLSGYFDARITYLPVVTLLSIVRAFADEALKEKLQAAGIRTAIANKTDAINRTKESQLATLLEGKEIGLYSNQKVGPDSKTSFNVMSKLASSSDIPLNRAFAEALKAAGLITEYETEKDFGIGLTRRTDIVAKTKSGVIRLEMMWRKDTSKAEIANYVLTKLFNYGKALGFLTK